MIDVESSMIRSVRYDSETQTLTVQFSRGGVYSYADVPPEEYDGLMAAESKGKYMHANIRTSYAYTKQRG